MFRVGKKLKNVKKALKVWKKKDFCERQLSCYQAFSLYSPKGALRKIATTTKGKSIYTHKS